MTAPPAAKLYWAKVLTATEDDLAFQQFTRQAVVASTVSSQGLVPLEDARLDAVRPILVYQGISGNSFSDWLLHRAQQPSSAVLLWLLRQAIETTYQLHCQGFVHGRINMENLFVSDHNSRLVLTGWGEVQLVGHPHTLNRTPSQFDAPETTKGCFESSTAIDIYALGSIFIYTFGSSSLQWPLVKAMRASNPNDRPSAAELLSIMRDLECHVFGQCISGQLDATVRAA